jgi:hypothetical protein
VRYNVTQRGLVRTKTGIVIGGAFTRRVEPGSQAEIIQRVLLAKMRPRRFPTARLGRVAVWFKNLLRR